MKITLVRNLIEQYGRKIIDETLSSEELAQLIKPETFAPSSDEVDSELPLTDENYSTTDAMRLFVLFVAPKANEKALLALTANIIVTTPPAAETGNFLQKASLVKFLLAYLQARNLSDQSLINAIALDQSLTVEAVNSAITLASQFFKKATPARFLAATNEGPEVVLAASSQNNETTAAVLYEKEKTVAEKSMFDFMRRGRASSIAITLNETQQAYVKALKSFASKYKTGAILEAARGEPKVNGVQKSTLKVRVAEDLIKAIESGNQDHELTATFKQSLETHFKPSLQTHELTSAQLFFKGDTKAKLGNDELYNILRSSVADQLVEAPVAEDASIVVKSNEITPVTTSTTTTAPSVFTGLGIRNMFGNSNITTDSNAPNADMIAQLTKLKDHYGSSAVQAHESIFNSNKKGQSKAKAAVATGLIAALQTESPNIANCYAELLAANDLSSEEFLSGKSKDYLSEESQNTLKTPVVNYCA